MSWRLMDVVLSLALPAEHEQVLMRLAQRASDDGTHCYPSVEELARSTGRNERTIQRALRALEADGHIKVLAYPNGGRGHATEWLVCPQVKGDTCATLLNEERVTPVTQRVTSIAERVTPVVIKGDTGVTPVDQEKIIEKISKRSGGAEAPARPAKPKITPQYIDELVAEFSERFNGAAAVRKSIERALIHPALSKTKNPPLRLKHWLEDDLGKFARAERPNGRANGHSPPLSAAAQRFVGVDSPFAEVGT